MVLATEIHALRAQQLHPVLYWSITARGMAIATLHLQLDRWSHAMVSRSISLQRNQYGDACYSQFAELRFGVQVLRSCAKGHVPTQARWGLQNGALLLMKLLAGKLLLASAIIVAANYEFSHLVDDVTTGLHAVTILRVVMHRVQAPLPRQPTVRVACRRTTRHLAGRQVLTTQRWGCMRLMTCRILRSQTAISTWVTPTSSTFRFTRSRHAMAVRI